MGTTRVEHVADGILFGLKCPKCGKQTEKPLSWFEGKDVLPCGNCGRGINLKLEPTRTRIKKMLNSAARTHAALTEAGKRG